MAEAAIADGITHVVGTPHSNNDYFFDYPRIRKLRRELQEKVGNRITLATGCDFHLSPENLEALRINPRQFCVNQGPYLLVEFNEFSIPPSMDQTLHELQLSGIRPIVTHPERNAILRAQHERLRTWVRLGCYVHITANSLTGTFGPGAQRHAVQWIAQGLVHFIASDAHNTGNRPLKLSSARDVLAAEFGAEKAQALVLDNPRAAFDGEEIPYVPELVDHTEPQRRRRFWFF